jgi:hypothetical protein
MPIQIERIERAIYKQIWQGDVSLADMQRAAEAAEQIAYEDHVDEYVMICDSAHMTRMPQDLRALRHMLEYAPRQRVVLWVSTPAFGRVIAQTIAVVTRQTFEFYDSLDSALRKARDLLTE